MGGFFSRFDSTAATDTSAIQLSTIPDDIGNLSLTELTKKLELLLASSPTSAIRFGSSLLAKLSSGNDDSHAAAWNIRRIVAIAAEDQYPRSALHFWNEALSDAPSNEKVEEALQHIKRLKEEFVARSLAPYHDPCKTPSQQ